MPEVVGYPLDRAGETLRREGISVRNVSVIKPPETGRKKYRPKEFEKKTKFVVFQRDVDEKTVDLDVVECGEPGTMKTVDSRQNTVDREKTEKPKNQTTE